MFFNTGFLYAEIMNDAAPDPHPCVPIVYPNASCPNCETASIHLEFKLPTIDDSESVKMDLPLAMVAELTEQCAAVEYGVTRPGDEVIFSFRTRVSMGKASLRQRMDVVVNENGQVYFKLSNTFRKGVPFLKHTSQQIRVHLSEKQLEAFCDHLDFLVEMYDEEVECDEGN
ncbi:MAG: hypothetical protein IKC24_06670 [Oscillospiraceae bacterium]|nr:hypothetical protein [Oscillospiraceae bacterium]